MAESIGNIKAIQGAVVVAIVGALVGHPIGVGINAGTRQDVTVVRRSILVAVGAVASELSANHPLVAKQYVVDGAVFGSVVRQIVGIDWLGGSHAPAPVGDGLANDVQTGREVFQRGLRHKADEEARPIGAHFNVWHGNDGPLKHRLHDDFGGPKDLGVGGVAVTVGIRPDIDRYHGAGRHDAELHLNAVQGPGVFFDVESVQPRHIGHVGPPSNDAEADVVEQIGFDIELALVGHTVGLTVFRGAFNDVAGVGNAVAVAIGIALVRNAIAVAVVVDEAAFVQFAVTIAIALAIGDFTTVEKAILVAVGKGKVVHEFRGRQVFGDKSELVDAAAKMLVEGTGIVGVRTNQQRTGAGGVSNA